MRVLVLHSRYASGAVSGENRVVDDHVRLLAEAGHEVASWTPGPPEGGPLALVRAGAGAVWGARAADRVRALVRRHRPDVVQCHNLFPSLSPVVLRAAAETAAVVLFLHNYRLQCIAGTMFRDGEHCELCVGRSPAQGVRHACYRGSRAASGALASSLVLHRSVRTLDRVDRFAAVSAYVREHHVEAGIDGRRVAVVPHFAWPVRHREGPGDRFAFLGRFSPEKGVLDLVRDWPADARGVRVIGDGPQAAAVRAAAGPNVSVESSLPWDRLPEVLRETRALLIPSRTQEAGSRVVAEAAAAGVPVVAAAVGGLPEMIEDGVSGVLVAEPAGWRAAIERLEDDRESERMGAGALKQWGDRYAPDRGLAAIERVSEEAIEARAARGPAV